MSKRFELLIPEPLPLVKRRLASCSLKMVANSEPPSLAQETHTFSCTLKYGWTFAYIRACEKEDGRETLASVEIRGLEFWPSLLHTAIAFIFAAIGLQMSSVYWIRFSDLIFYLAVGVICWKGALVVNEILKVLLDRLITEILVERSSAEKRESTIAS